MARRISSTEVKVHLVKLRLSIPEIDRLDSVRREAARLWNDIVAYHAQSRDKAKEEGSAWLNANDLEKLTKKGYALHSQSIQDLCQKLEANVKTWKENRKIEPEAKLPYKQVEFQTIAWKALGIKMKEGKIVLSLGAKRPAIVLPLPEKYRSKTIVRCEIAYKDGCHWLCLTEDTLKEPEAELRKVRCAGIDLGEIHHAFVMTEDGKGLGVVGRHLRSIKRLRNKSAKSLDDKLTHCKNGSKRHKRLALARKMLSDRNVRRERDILHKASRQVVEFCKQEQIAQVVIGDVRDIQHNGSRGQKINQWSHGQLRKYIQEKLRSYGIAFRVIDESYSTRTCCACGALKPSSPKGRVYSCGLCGIEMHRDGNGAANICSRGRYGAYGSVKPLETTYLRPLEIRSREKVVVPRTRAMGSFAPLEA